MKRIMRNIRYALETLALAVVMLLFRILPVDASSAFGGWCARLAGPFLRAHRVADTNLQRIFPEMDERQRRNILRGMWDNLGRVAGEYPHLRAVKKRITVEGAEILERIRDGQQSAVFVSGHFANWEVAPLIGVIYDLPVTFIYRAANNPFTEDLIQSMRQEYRHMMFGKGRESVQKTLKALQEKRCSAMLVDQKLGEGELVPFFGVPAMTATASAKLALRYRVPLIAIKIVRTDGAHFHATVRKVELDDTDTSASAMEKVHHVFEQWIRERPEQWFWVHNRWNWKPKNK